TGAAATFLGVSRQYEDCRASAVTLLMLSRRSPSISQSRSSKPTLLAFWRVCLISATRSIERLVEKHSGDTRAFFFHGIPPASTIRRLSISARWFVFRGNQNAGFAPSKNSAAQKIRKVCQ